MTHPMPIWYISNTEEKINLVNGTETPQNMTHVRVRVSRELNLVDSDHNFFKKRDRTEGNTKYQSALHTVRVRKASRTFCY